MTQCNVKLTGTTKSMYLSVHAGTLIFQQRLPQGE